MKNIKILLKELPPIIGRTAIDDLLPGIIDSRHLANLDSKGKGPPKHKIGKKVFYNRDEFIEWFLKRIDK